MDNDLRRSPRVPFIAAAEITDVQTETRLPARTGDLSRHGCYLDMVNPLPQGTAVRLQITHGQRTFVADAGVIYSQPPLGMGLVFHGIELQADAVLQGWLEEAVAS